MKYFIGNSICIRDSAFVESSPGIMCHRLEAHFGQVVSLGTLQGSTKV